MTARWKRRRFLSGAAAASCSGALAGCGETSDSSSAAPALLLATPGGESPGAFVRPSGKPALNVVFITADDLGWKALEAHPDLDPAPNLRELSASAQRFPWAFNASSSCSTSRATFATGLYPASHGVRGLVHRQRDLSLSPETFTVARALADSGYRTGIAGKYHISSEFEPEAFGYQEVGPRNIFSTEFIRSFISRGDDDAPFFVELNFTQTHRQGRNAVFPVLPEFPVALRDVRVPEYWALPDIEPVRRCAAGYLSQLRLMDHLIGETFAQLREAGVLERTVVLFVSDNGVAVPNNKMTLYDRGIGTPCLLWDPRREAAADNAHNESLVSSIDYAPTILSAAGLSNPELPGSVLGGAPERDAVFAEMFRHVHPVGMRGVRTRDWKFVINTQTRPIGRGGAGRQWALELESRPWEQERPRFELYHLHSDPYEQNNVVTDHPEVAAELYDRIVEHANAQTYNPPLPPLA